MDRIGPFEVVRLLGEGGMGRVYLARAAGGAQVAVKVVRSELAADPAFRSRFRREVEAASRVPARFTAAVLDADPDAAAPWFATAFVDGPSLSERVTARGPLPVADAQALALGLLDALVAVHGSGLVHRDLKPSNVLLAADGPRIIDFGIARAADGTRVTLTGHIVGTPSYMSPEQAEGRGAVGAAGDVFSLGSLLTFATTGAPPFRAPTTPAVLFRILHDEPDLDDVPHLLRGPVSRCLAKDPAARPSAAGLLAAQQGRAVPLTVAPTVTAVRSVPEPARPAPAPRSGRRAWAIAAVTAVAVVAIIAAVTWAVRPGTEPAEPAPAAAAVAAAAVSAPEPATVVDRTVAIDHPVDRMVAVADRIYVTDVATGAITVLDAGTGAVVASIPVGRFPVALAPAPDGTRLFVTLSAPAAVVAVDPATNTVVDRAELGGELDNTRNDSALEPAVSPDGTTLYLLNSISAELVAIDTATLDRRAAVPVDAAASDLAVSPDGSRIYLAVGAFGGEQAPAIVIDAAALTVIGELPGGETPGGLVVSSDGRRVFLAENGGTSNPDTGVSVLDTVTGERLTMISPPVAPDRLALDPGGRWLYAVGALTGTVTVIDTTTLRTVAELPSSSPLDVVPAPDGVGVLVLESVPPAVTVLRAP